MAKRSRTERAASAAGRTAGTSAGSFFGGISNNPGIIIIALVLGALFLFKDKIAEGIGGLGEGLGQVNIELPEINFPEINFPEFPDVFGDTGKTFQDAADSTGDFFGDLQKQFNDFFARPLTEADQFDDSGISDIDITPKGEPAVIFRDAEIFAKDFPEEFKELTPAQQFGISKGVLPSGFEFVQPDPSGQFGGGSINPTPIKNLSLSQIIDKFDVSASQAANILAIAKDDFSSFDFGTNTGRGIGSIIPTISEFIGGSDVNISNDQFAGLSAQEIANILTGGNIQNF